MVFHFTGLNAQEYPLNEQVKIYFDKDWRPTTIKDSASYYRLITFKEKNIPKGRVEDYYIDGIKQSLFYATYVGINNKGIDSTTQNGPYEQYYKSGIISYKTNYFNNLRVGEEISYNESGEINHKANYIDDLRQGKYSTYYKSGRIKDEVNYLDNLLQGEQIGYYESGEIKFKRNYVYSLIHGKYFTYYESGERKSEVNYVDDLRQGERIGYHKSGAILSKLNYVDDLGQGDYFRYYESGKILRKFNLVDDLIQGESIDYYDSGIIKSKGNYVNSLAQGTWIGYYESGEMERKAIQVGGLIEGDLIGCYKSGEMKFKVNHEGGLKQGEWIYFFKNGEIDYTELYVDDKKKERRLALVIGNADYDKGKLSNPVNDSNLIAESLEKLDFEVQLYSNLSTRDEMLDAIKDFGRKRKNYEIGFVYYAGHGIQLNNENYLLPVKEDFEYEEDVEDNGVSMQRVLRYLESTRENQLNFIVLDACRDNPFESNWNKTRSFKGGGLAKIPPPTGSLIAYSTDHGQTAADGNEGNSLYSKALAEKLLEEDVSIEQVFKNVRTEVLRLSNKSQSPVEESKLTGDAFYLNKKED